MTIKNFKLTNPNINQPKAGYLNFDFCALNFDFARKRVGFTLLETIVALAIIIIAVIGPVTLITRGLFSLGFAKNKLVALNLAQEGLELIRLVRENNILCDGLNGAASWDWFTDPLPGHASIITRSTEVDAVNTDPLDCTAATIQTPRLSNSVTSLPLRFNPATGIYSYSEPQETIFKRTMDVSRPNANESLPFGKQIRKEDIRDITSTVSWTERGFAKSVVLKERLYNWR